MRKVATVAEMTVRELARRRGVILLLLLLPAGLYLIRRGDHLGQSVRSLFLGLCWAISTASLFATIAGRGLDPRLRMAGYRGGHLVAGRLAGLWVTGVALSAPFFVLLLLDAPEIRYGATAFAMSICVAVSAPLGMLIGLLLPKEMEGTILLLITIGLQMAMDPSAMFARAAPFWSTREIGTYAIDLTDSGYLVRGTVHAAVTLVVLLLLVGLTSSFRLRRRRHLVHTV